MWMYWVAETSMLLLRAALLNLGGLEGKTDAFICFLDFQINDFVVTKITTTMPVNVWNTLKNVRNDRMMSYKLITTESLLNSWSYPRCLLACQHKF